MAKEKLEKYQKRKALIEKAFQKSMAKNEALPALLLSDLVSEMRAASREDDFLSSIYFAGGWGDHPYFLKHRNLAMGIAVLPEDAPKAGKWKRHPHQKEFMIMLEGEMLVQEKNPASGEIIDIPLVAPDGHLIKKNTCHRVLPVKNSPAVFVFVKSNPAAEPMGEAC